jgi:hypothetical protein
VAAKTEPARADRQFRTGESPCPGITEQVSDEFTNRLLGHLI